MSDSRKAPPFAPGEEYTREMARKGAAASKRIRRIKKSMREWALIFRDLPSKADPKMSMAAEVILKMYNAAINGDVKAANFLAELQGEMEERVSIKELPKLIDDIK